ncbi:MAG: glycosyltransferase family 92 protein [Paludibacteraceae bacterium]|nr:glycosyltransferase family 92 protein [Paludibacteraceae bacterium]
MMLKIKKVLRVFIFRLRLILYWVLVKLFCKKPKYNKKYAVSICAIFKNESEFLKEWIDFHSMLGVDHFYLYNNSSSDSFLDVLTPFIESGVVTLIDWPYSQAQIKAYNDFYIKYREETQWVLFLDIDEFVCPKIENNIQSWVRQYDSQPVILVYWKMFGTSALLEHDYSKFVIEQYTVSWPSLYKIGKCFVNTDYDISVFDASVHHCTNVELRIGIFRFRLPAIDQFGNFYEFVNTEIPSLVDADEFDIQINHYWSKAWSVYDKKRKSSDVYFETNPKANMNYFFRHEYMNTSSDYTIFKYLMKLKHKSLEIK